MVAKGFRNAKAPSPEDFNGPKKSRSGFFVFCDAKREVVTAEVRANLKEGEAFKVSMIASELGAQWKKVSEEEKKTFEDKAKEEKAEYEKKFEEWVKTADYKSYQEATNKIKKSNAGKKAKKDVQDAGMPKRPMAAYMRFSMSVQAEIKKEVEAEGLKASIKETSQRVKKRFDAAPQEVKDKFEKEYQEAKVKHEEEMANFKKSDAYKEYLKVTNFNAYAIEVLGKPVKGKNETTALGVWKAETKPDDDKKAKELFDALSDEEKKPFEEKAIQGTKDFDAKFAEWQKSDLGKQYKKEKPKPKSKKSAAGEPGAKRRKLADGSSTVDGSSTADGAEGEAAEEGEDEDGEEAEEGEEESGEAAEGEEEEDDGHEL